MAITLSNDDGDPVLITIEGEVVDRMRASDKHTLYREAKGRVFRFPDFEKLIRAADRIDARYWLFEPGGINRYVLYLDPGRFSVSEDDIACLAFVRDLVTKRELEIDTSDFDPELKHEAFRFAAINRAAVVPLFKWSPIDD